MVTGGGGGGGCGGGGGGGGGVLVSIFVPLGEKWVCVRVSEQVCSCACASVRWLS